MNKWILNIIVLMISCTVSMAQDTDTIPDDNPNIKTSSDSLFRVKLGDEWMYAMVYQGDTIYMSEMEEVSFTMPRTFKDDEEKRYYYKIKRSAEKVYPYAVKAIKIYQETKEETEGMKKRKSKKYTKQKAKELKEEFEAPLRKLTKTQGKVLIAMIERELDVSFFHVLKEVRGGFTASYWNTLGKMYGYKLKKKYDPEDDPIMEAVLSGYDINFED